MTKVLSVWDMVLVQIPFSPDFEKPVNPVFLSSKPHRPSPLKWVNTMVLWGIRASIRILSENRGCVRRSSESFGSWLLNQVNTR